MLCGDEEGLSLITFNLCRTRKNSRNLPFYFVDPIVLLGHCQKIYRFLMSQNQGSPLQQLRARKSKSDYSPNPLLHTHVLASG